MRFEEVNPLLYRHPEDLGNRFALIGDLQRLGVVASALAAFTHHLDIGHEAKMGCHRPIPRTLITTASLDIEAEPARCVTARHGLGNGSKLIADQVIESNVGSGV